MIRIGIGGWSFEPWRRTFYPADLPHKQELAYASRAVTALEINATFYRMQSPASFARWAEETPDDFQFALKAHRITTHRKLLAESKESIERFLASGIRELGDKLGPILWQLPPTKKFDPGDLEAFLKYLPARLGSQRLRHVLEVRHPTFVDERLPVLLRQYKVALCLADSEKYPMLADATSDFVYMRLQRARAHLKIGYPRPELQQWADRIRSYAQGHTPADLPTTTPKADRKIEDCFVFFINGAKVRAPHAARAMIAELTTSQGTDERATRSSRRA